MFLEDTYYFYKLTDYLVRKQGFEIIFIDNSETEIWLQRNKLKQNDVIRLINKEFDWKNQLKTDIERSISSNVILDQLILGRNIQLHNVYIAKRAPVDDWEVLKSTIKIKHRKFTNMHVYYLDDENKKTEKARLFDQGDIDGFEIDKLDNGLEMERISRYLRSTIVGEFQKSQSQSKQVFEYAKPFFTYVILAINVLMFLLLEWQGGSTSVEILIRYGAKYNAAILDGEWWRLVSSMFLHIGFVHLLMNMLALHIVGSLVERIYGASRFLTIYFFAGIIGGLTSFAFTPQLAAGASGAIFGLFGALLLFGIHYRRIFFQTMGWNVIVIIGFNIVFGFLVPQIDNGAHIGGLIGGFITSAIVFFPNKKQLRQQALAVLGYVGLFIALLLYGISNTDAHYDPVLQVQIAEQLVGDKEYNQVIDQTTEVINTQPSDYLPELLFLRSYAYRKVEMVAKARQDLEALIAIEPNRIPEAHYNLALVYKDSGETEKAKKSLETAIKLNPTKDSFTKLLQEWFPNE